MSSKRLSKSKVVLGQQCEKALYLSIHHPILADEVSDSQQMIFDQGHLVGQLAQTHFTPGVLVSASYRETDLALGQTQAAIKAGALNIYEASFIHENVLVKIDILSRKSTRSAWEIVEVKSSTSVKEPHLRDVAVQLWVARGAGLKVKSASVLFINNKCEFPNLAELFTRQDVTAAAEDLLTSLPGQVDRFNDLLAQKSAPAMNIGAHCDSPYPCAFQGHCWKAAKVPELSVLDIPRLSSDRKWGYVNDGCMQLSALDPVEFNASQQRMIQCSLAKTRYVDKPRIKKAMGAWSYPYSFLDFETIAYAVPRIPGQRPYQQIPFQFSCHIRRHPKKNLEHVEYLHTDDSDPREAMAEALAEMLPTSGSVIAYNMAFERGVLSALANLFPKYKKALESIADRLVDPLPIIRECVYDPAFRGSFSIKEVAPALLGIESGYDKMDVSGGQQAQSAFLEMTDPATTPARKEKLRRDLIAYCTQDTLNLVGLVDWMMS